MAPHVYFDALNRALNAELMQWGGSESNGSARRRGRTLAALVLGATTVVGVADDARPGAAPAQSTTEATGRGAVVPAYFRPAPDRIETITRVLANAQARVESAANPDQAVATVALELGRLQRDMAVRTPEGMEEWIGEGYASLEAVRRAVADAVVDEEDAAVVAVALDRAAQLLVAA